MLRSSAAILLAVVLFGVACNAQAASVQKAPIHTRIDIPDRQCNVMDSGATASNVWYDTEAFQRAIDTCAKLGGGTVVVPAGWYVIGPIFLGSNIRLDVQKGAVLQAAPDDVLYHPTPETQQWAGVPKLWPNAEKWLALINVADANNVAITGGGIIDGQGAIWWERWRGDARATGKKGSTNRPRLMFIKNSHNMLIEGVTLKNSPSFHIVFYKTSDLTINRINISSPDWAQNTDGIDPMDSHDVYITNNTISCGDDHIAFKAVFPDPALPEGDSYNYYIAGNTFLGGRGLSFGSETSAGVHNVLAENNIWRGSVYGVRIKSQRGVGGPVHNVVIRNSKMKDVQWPIGIAGYYAGRPSFDSDVQKALKEGPYAGGFVLGAQIYPADTDPAQPVVAGKTADFRDVLFENLVSTGSSDQAGYIIGLPERKFKDLVFKNVKIEADLGMQIRNAEVIAKGFKVVARKGSPFMLEKDGKVVGK